MAILTHGSLFSGIGGFDLAAEWMGWENIFHCEWNEFGQQVLKHYFPKSISYNDITKTDFTIHRGEIDILTGGFPCQPYSLAGKRKGKEDERHLWPEMLRAIREIQPRWVVGENVLGIVNWNGGLVFDEVQSDLEAAGYEVWPYVLPAVSVNAPHRRDRIWFVAFKNTYPNGRRSNLREKESSKRELWDSCSGNNERVQANDAKVGNAANPYSYGWLGCDCKYEEHPGKRGIHALSNPEPSLCDGYATYPFSPRPQRSGIYGEGEEQPGTKRTGKEGATTDSSSLRGRETERLGNRKPNEHDKACSSSPWENFPTQSPICTRNDGLPAELDGITFPKWRNESIKAAGNAIVPQVALQIFKAIDQYESNHRH